MTYKTQPGTIPHRAVEYLRTLPPGTEVSTATLADAVGHEGDTNLAPFLLAAVKHGAIVPRKVKGVRSYFWSLGDGTPQAVDPEEAQDAPKVIRTRASPDGQAFNAALWIDGSLIVVGAQRRPDGAVVLTPEQTRQLRSLVGA